MGVLILGGMHIQVQISDWRELKTLMGMCYFQARANLQAFTLVKLPYCIVLQVFGRQESMYRQC